MTEKQRQYFVRLCYERSLNPEEVLNILRFLNLPEGKAIDLLKRVEKNSAFIEARLNAEIIKLLYQDTRLGAVKYLKGEDFAKFLSYPGSKEVLESLLPQILSYQWEYKIKPIFALPSEKGFKRRLKRRLRYEISLLIGLIVLLVFVSITERLFVRDGISMPVESFSPAEVFLQKQEEANFDCSECPSRCAEYSSCNFAKFCAFQCGKSWLDGDKDGRPCEWGPC